MVVAKFGGTSMANAKQMRKVAEITNDDKYSIVVVSAPGKRFKGDTKVTDLLYKFIDDSSAGDEIYKRFLEIEDELGINHNASDHFLKNREFYLTDVSNKKDIVASRGEFYSAMIFAEFTGRKFLDTKDLVTIKDDGNVDETSYNAIKKAIDKNTRYVVPGFYGKDKNGNIKTFSRGGSDITGSIFARSIGADVYENWTDVSGVFATDPNLIPSAKKIDKITYTELLLLGENGAQVFHPLAIEPVKDLIPIHIKNTNAPLESGTLVTTTRDYSSASVIAVSEKDGVISVIGSGKVIYQEKISKIEEKVTKITEIYNKYIK